MRKYLIALMTGLALVASAMAAAPIYVVDARGESAFGSLSAACDYLQEAVPDAGVLCVRICEGITVDEDIAEDLAGNASLTHLVIEGGRYTEGRSEARSDTVIRVAGKQLAEGQSEPAAAGDIVNVRVSLPANAILEVRHLRFSGCIQFDAGTTYDATRSVTVHDCLIDSGWYVAQPAAGSYSFARDEFTSGFEGYAVFMNFTGKQTHDCNVDFSNNTVQSFRVLNTSTSGNLESDAATNVRMTGNTFVHTGITKERYLKDHEGACMGLCQVTGKVNGDIVITGNRMLGYFHHEGAVPALLAIHRMGTAGDAAASWMAAGSTVEITGNDRQCDVVEVAYHGEAMDATELFVAAGATISGNGTVHLYPADSSGHTSLCHVCAACKEAIVRVEVENGSIDSGVQSTAVVRNYGGYGMEITSKETPNACVIEFGATNTVVCTGYEGELTSYIFEGPETDFDFTLWPWPHTGNTYTLKIANTPSFTNPDLAFARCPKARIAFEQKYVHSANMHASVRVDADSTNVLIAVPWTFYTPDGSPSISLPLDHLVRPINLEEGDMLLNVVDSKVYDSWMLVPDAGGALRWTPATSVASNAPAEAQAASGVIASTAPAADKPIPRGVGLWLIRTAPKSGEDWKPFYLYGQWAKGGALVTVSGSAGGDNAVMIAHPCCTRPLSVNGDIRWSGVGAEDTLSIPNGTDAPPLAYWDAGKGQWWMAKTVRSGRRVISERDYNIVIPTGCGFWYTRREASDITIEFVDK